MLTHQERTRPSPALHGVRAVLASLDHPDCGIRWARVRKLGQVRRRRTRQGKERWVVDLRPLGETYTVPGFGPLRTREDAEAVLAHIRGELARGEALEAILAHYLPKHSKAFRIEGLPDRRAGVPLAGPHAKACRGRGSESHLPPRAEALLGAARAHRVVVVRTKRPRDHHPKRGGLGAHLATRAEDQSEDPKERHGNVPHIRPLD